MLQIRLLWVHQSDARAARSLRRNLLTKLYDLWWQKNLHAQINLLAFALKFWVFCSDSLPDYLRVYHDVDPGKQIP